MKFLVYRLLAMVSAAALLAGCSGGFALARLDDAASGTTLQHGSTPFAVQQGPASFAPLAWFSPAVESDRVTLSRWRASVGPPLVRDAVVRAITTSSQLTIVSWNTALGAGDVARLVADLRGESPRPIVLLLQEVYRRGPAVPQALGPGARFAARLGGARGSASSTDVDSLAATLGMFLYYVPSMRNGGLTSDEDRGNAILSDLPLSDLTAIELPFERQRRVAIAATVAGEFASGEPWRLRLVNAHLDNTVPRRGYLGSEFGRARQARGLVALLEGATPMILGGDFNTWFGFSDQVFLETAPAFPQTSTADRGATFMGMLRLDHVFYRLPAGWRGDLRRAPHRYGSDHTPLIGRVRLSADR